MPTPTTAGRDPKFAAVPVSAAKNHSSSHAPVHELSGPVDQRPAVGQETLGLALDHLQGAAVEERHQWRDA
jgi:hypothetical protein